MSTVRRILVLLKRNTDSAVRTSDSLSKEI